MHSDHNGRNIFEDIWNLFCDTVNAAQEIEQYNTQLSAAQILSATAGTVNPLRNAADYTKHHFIQWICSGIGTAIASMYMKAGTELGYPLEGKMLATISIAGAVQFGLALQNAFNVNVLGEPSSSEDELTQDTIDGLLDHYLNMTVVIFENMFQSMPTLTDYYLQQHPENYVIPIA